jgi:hypothetical protein
MKKQFLILLCLLFFIISGLKAQDGEASGNNYITGLIISGLKRTKLSTAERPLKQFIGTEADLLDQNEVWAAVLNTGILEPLSVEIQDSETEGKILAVTVKEKWSIFPVPVVMFGSEGFSAGAALFDANAFGLNDKFFLAGLYLSGGWLASVGYIHASPGGRVPGINGTFSFSSGKRKDVDQNNKVLRSFDQNSISLMAGLNFNLLKNSNLLSASSNFSYNEKILRNSETAINGPENGLRSFNTGLRLSLNRSSWDGYLLSQEEASLQYTFHMASGGYYFQSLNLRAVWEKSLFPGFRLVMRTGLVYDPNAPIFFESSPSSAQVDILPRSFSAKNYVGVSAGLEKYLFKFPIGILSVAASYQLVYSYGSILGDSLDHGVMGKLSFYLSQLAIPAIGLGAAYNVKENYFQMIFSMGMSF